MDPQQSVTEILDVNRSPHDRNVLWGFAIDRPRKGEIIENEEIVIAGWVLGKSSPVKFLKILCNDTILYRGEPSIHRPDVARVYPQVSRAASSGFYVKIPISSLPKKSKIELIAVLENKIQYTIGKIHFQDFNNLNNLKRQLLTNKKLKNIKNKNIQIKKELKHFQTGNFNNTPRKKTKRIAIYGNPNIENAYLLNTKQIMRKCGNNTGNQLFRHAIASHILDEKEYIDFQASPQYIKDNFDLIIIPSANQMNPKMNLAPWAEALEKFDLPLLPIGLGAQGDIDFSENVKLHTGTERYLHLLSERSQTIGVRGEYTAKQLEKIGITNVEVIGCPSHYLNPKKDLGTLVEPKYRKRPIQSVVIASCVLRQDPKHKVVERHLLSLAKKYRNSYICQSPYDEVALARMRIQDIQSYSKVINIKNYLCPNESEESFMDYVANHFVTYFSIEAWLEHMSRFNFTLGKRIHGNIVSMQAMVPSLVLVHDSRTRELAETLKLPYMYMEEVLKYDSIEFLLDSLNFLPNEFDRNRLLLAKRYKRLFSENGLSSYVPIVDT